MSDAQRWLIPATMPLGTGLLDGKPGLVLATLSAPVIELSVRPAAADLVSGACAERMLHFLSQHDGPAADVEIEQAIPMHMGLGSDLALAHAASQIRGRSVPGGGLRFQPHDDSEATVVMVEHSDDHAWVFVFALPAEADGTPDDFESQRIAALAANSGPNCEGLFDAARERNFARFASELSCLCESGARTLPAAPAQLDAGAFSDVMHAHGISAHGPCPAGYGYFGLTEGGPASRAVRAALQMRFGYFGPMLRAAIIANHGPVQLSTVTKPG